MTINYDSVFISWNKATLKSLRNQINLAHDSSEIKMFQNREQALKAYLDIEDENLVNQNSVRYHFLSQMIEKMEKRKDFYVIEANRSGEKVEIRNYLFNTDNLNLEVYNFVNHSWIKSAVIKKENFHFDSDLRRYFTTLGKGVNSDDVIITHFVNGTVLMSEYYLYTMLSGVNDIQSILK